jgi:hypothetical protein
VAFTKRTVLMRDYSNKYVNLSIDEKVLNSEYYTAVASISTEGKVEHLLINQGAINGAAYGRFLRQLRAKNGDGTFAIFQDNLSIHRTLANKQLYQDLGLNVIWNVPYRPQYQPIESIFSIVKGYYKKRRLHMLANGIEVNERTLIRESFRKVESSSILN